MFARAFLLINKVIQGAFEDLAEEIAQGPKDDFNYFEDYNAGRKRQHGRAKVLFPGLLYSMDIRQQGHQARANNSVKEWHRDLKEACRGALPCIEEIHESQ